MAVFLILFGFILAAWNSETVMGGMMGHHDESTGFPFGTLVALLGVLLFIVAIIIFRAMRPQERVLAQPVPYSSGQPRQQVESNGVTREDLHNLTLKLLNGDERKMYRLIMEGGGSVLQKDLVARGMFSGAKVTRLLDKLENKGLIVRERYGSTNRIRISDNLKE